MVLLKELRDPLGGMHGAFSRLAHAVEEKREPRLPFPLGSNPTEQAIVLAPVLLEVETQVEEWLAQHSGMTEKKRDEQAADPSVSVEERMDGLELDVGEAGAQQHGQPVLLRMQESLESAHAVGNHRVGWRHEGGVARTAPADPVLRATEFTGLVPASASPRKEDTVHLPEQSIRQRESAAQAGDAMV